MCSVMALSDHQHHHHHEQHNETQPIAETAGDTQVASSSGVPSVRKNKRKTSRLAVLDHTGKYHEQDVVDIVLVQAMWRRRVQRKQLKSIIKRTHIIQELLSTEKVYVDSLRYVIEKYEKPLNDRLYKGSAVVPEKDLKTIFFQIQNILTINFKLLSELEERRKGGSSWNVWKLFGDIFVEMSKSLESYTAFVNNYELAAATLRKQERTNNAFVLFASELEMASAQRLKLADYLIMPVQRIPRYELLLSQILAHTQMDHPDFANIKKAVFEIKRVADFINEKKRQAEARAKVSEIESKMAGDFQPLDNDTRLFIREGDIVASLDGAREMRRLFLFNDALLCASKLTNGASSHIVSKVMNSGHFEFEFDWMVSLSNLKGLHQIERPVKEKNYIEPDEIMKEIVRLEKQLEIERQIERSAAKIAQIYKMENNRATKNEAKREVGETESNMELIAKELKYQRERMRLYEPTVGLAIVTKDDRSFTFVVRSTSQRDEWLRDISHWLGVVAKEEMNDAKKKKSSDWSFKSMLDASVASLSSLSTLSKSVGQNINKKVIEGVSSLASASTLMRSNTTVQPDRRRLVRSSPSIRKPSRDISSSSLAEQAAGPTTASPSRAGSSAKAFVAGSSTYAAPTKTDEKNNKPAEPVNGTEKLASTPAAPPATEISVVAHVTPVEPSPEGTSKQSTILPSDTDSKSTSPAQSHKENSQTADETTTLRGDDSPGRPWPIKRDRAGSLMGITVLPSSPVVEFNPIVDAPQVTLPATEEDEEATAERSHKLETKEFARSVRCDVCSATIAPFGREGLKCADCSIRCHRKCSKLLTVMCNHTRDPLMDQLDETAEVTEESLLTPGVFLNDLATESE